jgi:ApbE superfamily uncharacterized protein (UPF0280 family)
MGAPDDTDAKQKRGRFKPGETGNPNGRPKGSRNRVTVAVEKLLEADAENIAKVAVEFAKGGDTTLIKAVLDRIAPPRKEPTLTIELPPIKSPADAPAVAARLVEAAASGEITPGEAQALAALLESYRRQSELADIENRLRALEEQAHAKR